MIDLRPAEEQDLAPLSGLFEDRFGHPISPEEWRWKYLDLPGEARSWVAVGEGGELLAHAGALCLPARLSEAEGGGSEGAGIWQLTDWVGSTARAGLRPPLVTLGRALLADLPRPGDAPWIFGFPSERHFRLGRRVFGYQPLPPIMPLAGEIPEPADRAPDQGRAESGLAETTDHLDGAPERLEPSWEACAVLGVRRSVAFLNWRYHARPGRYYRFYRLRATSAGEGDKGLAVFAFVGREAWAAELWLPTRRVAPEAWSGALLAVAADLREAGLERWIFWPPPEAAQPLLPVLEGLGLRETGSPQTMGCRGAGGSPSRPVCPDLRFYYGLGDYDVV